MFLSRFIRTVAITAISAAAIHAPAESEVFVDEEEVVFRLRAPGAERVYLVGDFNGWNPTIDRMVEAEKGFEIRLFLLPGRYRYRFIVDGTSRSDSDSPLVDEKGNSYFVLGKVNEVLRIFTGEGLSEESAAGIARAVSGTASLAAGSADRSIYVRGDTKLSEGEHAEAVFSVCLEYEAPAGASDGGRGHLLKGSAVYRFDGRTFEAFSRSGNLHLGDPLELFGRIGPFDYPLGLFCRGVGLDGEAVLGFEGKLFFAGRLEGYRSGLEEAPQATAYSEEADLFSKRDLTDSDMIGLRIGRRLGALGVHFLYRRDRRPREGSWVLPGHTGVSFTGFERTRFKGFWITLEGAGSVKVDIEYLSGGRRLSSVERISEEEGEGVEFRTESDWESGGRFFTGLTVDGGRLDLRLNLERSTLTGESLLREGRGDGVEIKFGGALGIDAGGFRLGLETVLRDFSADNTGEVFWLQRRNFWLDGDGLDVDLIPFLAARNIYEFGFDLSEKDGADDVGPFDGRLRLSFLQRGDQSFEGLLLREFLLKRGFPLHRRLNLFLDLRFVTYKYRESDGTADFLDTFAALQSRLTDDLWCSLGFGVSPYSFDRWLYSFERHGRKDYLIDEGVFEAAGYSNAGRRMEIMEEAEESMSEDWTITFEAGLRF